MSETASSKRSASMSTPRLGSTRSSSANACAPAARYSQRHRYEHLSLRYAHPLQQ